jgi:hypothetical protein
MKYAAAMAAAVLLWSSAASAAARFALVVGNDIGSPSHPKLWFAERDAARFAAALTEVGEFPADRVVVLRGSSASGFRGAFGALEQRIAAEKERGERTLLIVYFSGHASEAGLEMGAERLPYEDLREMLLHSGADARVALVDACDSGALTQVKGGRASASVNFPLPLDDRVAGVAFIASTSLGEPAQESVALQGSFFTTHLAAALRGAGDLDGDGKVTLTEAFRYTSAQTVSETAQTQAGPQHPTYEMKMSGRGDVVLSDLRHAESTLVLPAAAGLQYIVRGPRGVVAELPGSATPVHLALAPGHYVVQRVSAAGQEQVEVDLARGQSRALPAMGPAPFLFGARKGGASILGLYGGVELTSGSMLHEGVAWGGQIGISHRFGPIRARVAFNYSQSTVDDAGLTYGIITTSGTAALLVPLLPEGGFRFEPGLQGGCGWTTQLIQNGPALGAFTVTGGGLVSMSYPVGVLRIGTDLSAGVQRFVLDSAPVVRFSGGAMLTVGADL